MSKMGQYVYERQTLWDECYASGIGWDEFLERCRETVRSKAPNGKGRILDYAWDVLAEMKREKAINEGK